MLKSSLSSTILAVSMISLMFLMTLTGLFDYDGHASSEYKELEKEELPLFAPSPGHSVFGESVGAHWCGLVRVVHLPHYII